MEILQTIWNALTSENEFLVKVVSMPLTVLEIYLYMLISLTLLKIDSTTGKRLTFVLSFSFISILNNYFGTMPYNTFINVLAMPFLMFLIFKTSILKSVLAEIIVYIIVLLTTASLVSVYSALLGVSSSVTFTIPIHKILFSLIVYLCFYIIYKICKKFNINITLFDKLKRIRNAYTLIINFIVGSVAIGVEYFLLFNYIDVIPQSLVFTILAITALYFGISMFSLIRTNKLEITTQNLEEQKMYNKTLTTLHDNIRGFKHDFDNIVQAVGGYLSTNNIDGLKIYYKDLLEECQLNNNLSVLNPELINNPVIYSLLADKYYKSEKLGIKMNLEVMMDLSNLNIKSYELTRILGILLDNSVEAASKCNSKIVNITFRKDKHRNKDLIIIQNTYANKDIDINNIFEKGYTSKADNEKAKEHGLGLWEVRKYIKKNPYLDLSTTKTDEYFTQQLEIFN